ncbi:MAG: hypothetical protein K8R74_07695 [Bacteroidales bacterium]|nr:hypothetical protein [Bacteroidales bacterium]
MKKVIISLVTILIPFIISAQSVSPEVISSSGDYYEGVNASLRWTLGEIATETYTAGNIILTKGFQQPITVAISGIDLVVFLEGPYAGTEMTTDLNLAGEIPLSQPYTGLPWNYPGTESVGSIPNTDVVDWVLIELRDATSATNATGAKRIAQQAGFLLKDGSVVGVDGLSNLQFSTSFSSGLYLIVWHRNHLGVLSATALTGSGGLYSYDFSTSLSQAHGGGAGYKLVGTSVYGMPGGDENGDGDIDATDKAAWTVNAGTEGGYQSADFNMDNQVNNPDKNDTWVENTTQSSQVPD